MAIDSKRRLMEVRAAFQVLATGNKLLRGEIFPGASESWQVRLLKRLVDEEWVIHHPSVSNNFHRYEAVDSAWFSNLTRNEVKLAEWYFKKNQTPPLPVTDAPPAKEPTEEPQQVFKITPNAAPPEEVQSDPEQSLDRELLQQILNTLVMCAENLVYIRDQLKPMREDIEMLRKRTDAIDPKVDILKKRIDDFERKFDEKVSSAIYTVFPPQIRT